MTLPKQIVLIVEDDEAIRQILSEILEFEGYQTATAVNGLDALTQLKTGPEPQLILLDMRMPVLNGRQFLAIIKADVLFRNIPVVVVSATADLQDIEGAENFLKKPIDPVRLLELVAYHTGNSKPASLPSISY